VRRDWRAAREKVEREARCRVGPVGCTGPLQAAHVIGRKHDLSGMVNPYDIVPLCQRHHNDYDGRRLDLLPHLSFAEQAAAVGHVGIMAALRRITSTR